MRDFKLSFQKKCFGKELEDITKRFYGRLTTSKYTVEIHLFLFSCFLEVKITLYKYCDTLMCTCIYTQLSMYIYIYIKLFHISI